jgi:hypothetical protein
MTTYTVTREPDGIRITKRSGLHAMEITLLPSVARPRYWDLVQAIQAASKGKKKVSFTFTTTRPDDPVLTFDGTAAEADGFARQFKAALDAAPPQQDSTS